MGSEKAMREEVDADSMIKAITEGVGAGFGVASRRSFHEQLRRLETLPRYKDCGPKEKQSLVDVLALAAFFQSVVVPLESTNTFMEVLETAGATHLRVAKDKLDERFGARCQYAVSGFYQLIGNAGIPPYLLTYPTLDKFASGVIRHFSDQP